MKTFKKYLIYAHRYLGLAFCVMFALWFVSGIVMVYKRMPRLSAEERLQRLPVLDFAQASLTPVQAWSRAGASDAPDKIRLGMHEERPVYRFLTASNGWATVFADNGERLSSVSAEASVRLVNAFFSEGAGRALP